MPRSTAEAMLTGTARSLCDRGDGATDSRTLQMVHTVIGMAPL